MKTKGFRVAACTPPRRTNDGYLTKLRFDIILKRMERCKGARVRLVLIAALGMLSHPGYGGRVAYAQTDDPIVVEHADTWRGTGVDDRFDLAGHVRITQGETTLTSDRVQYFRAQGRMILDGDVRVTQPKTMLHADHVAYFERQRLVVADGSVTLIDRDAGTTLTGGHAEYYQRPRLAVFTDRPRLVRIREDENVVITGRQFEYFVAEADSAARAVVRDSVVVYDRTEHVTVTCRRAVYTQAPEQAVLTGRPRLVKRSTSEAPSVVVTGDRMTYGFAEKRADVLDSVIVRRGKIYGVCDTAVYFSEGDRARLTGDPVLREGNSTLRGNEIVLHLEEDVLKKAVITGEASGAYAPDDSLSERRAGPMQRSAIQGRSLTVLFDAGSVQKIIASHNAISSYRPSAGSDTGPQGPNEVRANRIALILDHGRLVQVLARGSVIGTYEVPPEEQPPQ